MVFTVVDSEIKIFFWDSEFVGFFKIIEFNGDPALNVISLREIP